MAWQWPAQSLHDNTQGLVRTLLSSNPDRVYAAVSYHTNPGANDTLCAVLAALHSGNGTAIWQYQLCLDTADGAQAGLTLMQPPLSTPALGERLILALSSSVTLTGVADVVDGHTGGHLSSTELHNAWSYSLEAVGQGREGYFTFQTLQYPMPLQLHQLLPNNTVTEAWLNTSALDNAALSSQPALRYENNTDLSPSTLIVARDISTYEQLWASVDAFLIGQDWTPTHNDTFTHFFTWYQLLDGMPDVFLVINSAYNNGAGGNNTVAAQVGMYELANGRQLSLSPQLIFDQLEPPGRQPHHVAVRQHTAAARRHGVVHAGAAVVGAGEARQICDGGCVARFEQLAGGRGRLVCGTDVP